MLRAYVYDHGWEGAEIYVTESREKAIAYFRDKWLPLYVDRAAKHNTETNGENRWLRWVNNYESGAFFENVRVYDLVEGAIFETEGE